jgi:phage terminase large subunit-like protein
MRLVGSEEPRIFTPPLRELTPETTLGFAVIAFADAVLELELMPWQRWLLLHMLELREGGGLRYRTVILLMARQNGKSTLSQVLALWFMYVYGAPLVIGTAQDLDVA